MGFPWRKLASIGKAVGGIFYPPLIVAIETAESAYEGIKGAGTSKAQDVEIAYQAMLKTLNVDLALLSDDQRAAVEKAVKEARDTYVAARNAEAEAKEAAEALEALLTSFKRPTAPMPAPIPAPEG
jgi:hypothetical protein